MFYSILFISCFFSILEYTQCDKLLAVTTLVSHGKTLSYEGYDSDDPYLDEKMEILSDDLLNLGVQDLFNVGKWMRKHYSNFLSPNYNASEIYVQSSNFDSCLMSAEAVLAALYPPIGDEIWNPIMLWQPVPVHSSSIKHDILLQWTACPFYTNQSREAIELKKKISEENSELFEFLTEQTASKVALGNTLLLYNILEGEKLINLTLPLWSHGIIRDLKPLVDVSLMVQSMDKNLKKIRSGPLIHRILTQFEAAISGRKFGTTKDIYRKMMLYSTSDMTEYNLAESLNMRDIGMVNHGFSFYFELKEADGGKLFVDIFLRNSTDVDAPSHYVNIEGFGRSISYDDFRDIAGRVSLDLSHWNDLCESLCKSENPTTR